MLDWKSLSLFFSAAAVLLLVPGPAVMYIVARSLDGGRRVGLIAVLGIALGTFCHILAAVLGLSLILATSALAFNVVKYAGAAYLIFLGIRKLAGRDSGPEPGPVPLRNHHSVFWEGALVNLLNPKTSLFFLAFLPQFADPVRGPVWAQILILGVMFLIMGIISDGLYVIVAGSLSDWRRRNARAMEGARIVSGGMYVALGLLAALSPSSRTR